MELNDRIKSTAFGLFSKYGISSVTMDMIAKECGISKRTLYEQFPDKKSLVGAALLFSNEAMERLVDEHMSHSENVMESFIYVHSIVMERISRISETFFIDLRRLYPGICDILSELKERQQQRIFSLIERGKREGMIRRDVNAEIISSASVMQDSMKADGKYSRAEVYGTLFTIFLRGIATEKGLKIIENSPIINKK